jgi:hypothetical protein
MKYISDANLIKIVILPYFLGTLAFNGIKIRTEEFFNLCKTSYVDILADYGKQERLYRITKRLDKLACEAIKLIMNKQNSEVNTHKAILAMNDVIQMAIDNNLFTKEIVLKIVSLMEPFQEIEANMQMSDEDWLALRASAKKQAEKIYEIFYA